MIGIAKIMVTLKNEWKGTLVLVAQPAEELLQGAQAMVGAFQSGFLNNVIPPSALLKLNLRWFNEIEVAAKATAEGKKYPFFNHNGNYQVDLSAIPLGTIVGATALLEMFRN